MKKHNIYLDASKILKGVLIGLLLSFLLGALIGYL